MVLMISRILKVLVLILCMAFCSSCILPSLFEASSPTFAAKRLPSEARSALDVIFRERSLITAASSSTDPACSAAPLDSVWAPAETCSEPQETCSAEMFICLKVSFREAMICSRASRINLKSPI